MHRQQLQTIALTLMWIGAIEIIASFLAKMWFTFEVSSTPFFFLTLLVGVVLYLGTRLF